MEVKEMTISDVLKTPEFYNNLKVVISDLENTRRNAGISANAPLKRHPIDRLQEKGVFEPGQMTVLYASAMDKKLKGYSSSERTFILNVGGEAFNKTMKQLLTGKRKKMKQSVNDLKPGMMMLVIKNDNGTFSPVYMDEFQNDFLDKCLASLSKEKPLIKGTKTELYVKQLDDEKKRDNSNGND